MTVMSPVTLSCLLTQVQQGTLYGGVSAQIRKQTQGQTNALQSAYMMGVWVTLPHAVKPSNSGAASNESMRQKWQVMSKDAMTCKPTRVDFCFSITLNSTICCPAVVLLKVGFDSIDA